MFAGCCCYWNLQIMFCDILETSGQFQPGVCGWPDPQLQEHSECDRQARVRHRSQTRPPRQLPLWFRPPVCRWVIIECFDVNPWNLSWRDTKPCILVYKTYSKEGKVQVCWMLVWCFASSSCKCVRYKIRRKWQPSDRAIYYKCWKSDSNSIWDSFYRF